MAKPKQQCAMQILTLDYLIDGTVDLDDELICIFEGGSGYYEARDTLTITSARIQPAGNLTTPTTYAPQWMLSSRGGVVAFIPQDETGTQALLKAAPGKTFSFRAVIYAGPYIIQASLLPGDLFERSAFIHAQDAEINCQVPGAQLKAFTAPWILFNIELVQGYHPA